MVISDLHLSVWFLNNQALYYLAHKLPVCWFQNSWWSSAAGLLSHDLSAQYFCDIVILDLHVSVCFSNDQTWCFAQFWLLLPSSWWFIECREALAEAASAPPHWLRTSTNIVVLNLTYKFGCTCHIEAKQLCIGRERDERNKKDEWNKDRTMQHLLPLALQP